MTTWDQEEVGVGAEWAPSGNGHGQASSHTKNTKGGNKSGPFSRGAGLWMCWGRNDCDRGSSKRNSVDESKTRDDDPEKVRKVSGKRRTLKKKKHMRLLGTVGGKREQRKCKRAVWIVAERSSFRFPTG